MSERRRRTDPRKKRKQRRRKLLTNILIGLGGIGFICLSFLLSALFFRMPSETAAVSAPKATPMPYDAERPFTMMDLTIEQQQQLQQQKRFHVSDGPRGISIGDSLEKILDRYPSKILDQKSFDEQTGEQSDEQQILYCSDYYLNDSGKMTALPPRGLLNVDSGSITVTLLAPVVPYPPGTKDDYGQYEHVSCIYTINPETMSVSSIVLGIDN